MSSTAATETPEEPAERPKTATSTPTKDNDDEEATKPAVAGDSRPRINVDRPRSKSKPPEAPTLLTDFLLGRPSPARLAAERQRRQSVEAVKAELRHEMRQSAVRKVQPPGGVRDRVKAWQKANAAAVVATGCDAPVDDAATEPTDIAFDGEDFKSVTEEDRVRIKMRQNKRPPKPRPVSMPKKSESKEGEEAATPANRSLPKKRVVSDDNWMKNKTKNRVIQPRKISPRARRASPKPRPRNASPPGGGIPKDFTLRRTQNPVATRVKEWAAKVEIPDTPPPRSYRSSNSRERGARSDTETELTADTGSSVSRSTTRLRPKSSTSLPDDGIRVRPIRKAKAHHDDGIRVSAMSSPKSVDKPTQRTPYLAPNDNGIRVRPMSDVSSAVSDSLLDARPSRNRSRKDPEPRQRDDTPSRIEVIEEPSDLSQSTGVTKETEEAESLSSSGSETETERIEVEEDYETEVDTPTKRKPSKSRNKVTERGYHHAKSKSHGDVISWVKDDLGTDFSATQQPISDLSSSLADKSVADIPGEIPWGHSAFSELELPLNGPARTRPKRPAKADRGSSLKGMGVFKKVMEEGKKMIQEMNEPPRPPPAQKPPSIEKWLSTTIDPFVEDETSTPTKAAPAESKSPQPQSPKEPIKESPKPQTPKETTREEIKESPKAAPSPATPKDSQVPKREKTKRHSSHHSKSAPDLTLEEKKPMPPRPTPSRDNLPSQASNSRSDSPNESRPSSSSGLKRSKATRGSASPLKPPNHRPLFGMLKEAFTGSSGEHTKIPTAYQSQEERQYEDEETMLDDDDDDDYTVTDCASTYLSGDTRDTRDRDDRDDRDSQYSYSSETESALSAEPVPRMAGPRLRPPTFGKHELSTILSEEASSGLGSDMTSDYTASTLTQSTVLTKESSQLSRNRSDRSRGSQRSQRSQGNHAPGLKRRLTKHSDLVSVLSLPDDTQVPQTMKSNRSRPSLRRSRGLDPNVSDLDLLHEFAEDEGLYLRELKTLVDGVIPVLLSHVMKGSAPTELFGAGARGEKDDALSKSVVHMGVSLEKMRNAHRKAPRNDLRKLGHWAHGLVPIYSTYLGAWRLGFQDLVVNLAPAAGDDENDSLLNAMPRDENGDVVNSEGERVDVAHLLKRPLIRVKQFVKLINCIDQMMPSEDTHELLRNFEELQDKARRRHREEMARMTDEDATNTDTTRARDLRTLGALEDVIIDPRRQVSAKDIFSLDLEHSNGQRLECQVELIHRDRQKELTDAGDVLIRETGGGRRTYLLFPPISMDKISARTGDGKFGMVVMVRGFHSDRQWHELLTLTADDEDQILDWLDILPLNPVPPREPEASVLGDDDEPETRLGPVDIPFGARSIRRPNRRVSGEQSSSPRSPSTPLRRTPTRYHARTPSQPKSPPESRTPPPTSPESPESPESRAGDKTPTQECFPEPFYDEDRSHPVDESMRPDPLRLQKKPPLQSASPFRTDGAPPPPVHRTLSPSPTPEQNNTAPSIQPKIKLRTSSGGIKRRGSSPLKHEYLPSSDGSSVSEYTISEESDVESSDDEIESVDIPETELGVSIRDEDESGSEDYSDNDDDDLSRYTESPSPPPARRFAPMEASECSLTPSASASQAGHRRRTRDETSTPPEEDKPTRYLASVSRWSENKGQWKEVNNTPCYVVVRPGLVEVYPVEPNQADPRPFLALDLTPLVLLRQSTAVDLEIRSSMQQHCQLYDMQNGGNFRFRCQNGPDCFGLYMSVHHARLNNQKFIQLEQEARFRSFGEKPNGPQEDAETNTSSKRRSWFGRKNSYRSSVRAPTGSGDGASTTHSSALSASSFLKRLTVAGNLTFNLARSSVDKNTRPVSARQSLYSSSSYTGADTPPRSPSISIENSRQNPQSITAGDDVRIRLHLLVSSAKWEDFGNCTLQIRRPPPGWRQALRADHGLEKRVTVTSLPKKDEEPKILLDAVLGSGCFSPMGSRGIVCGVWEDVKSGGEVGATGPTGGSVRKWCFQCGSVAEAGAVLRILHQEVMLL